jgi:hypothetical protein
MAYPEEKSINKPLIYAIEYMFRKDSNILPQTEIMLIKDLLIKVRTFTRRNIDVTVPSMKTLEIGFKNLQIHILLVL